MANQLTAHPPTRQKLPQHMTISIHTTTYAPVSSTLGKVELVVRQPFRRLRADEAVVQPPPRSRRHYRRCTPDSDHAALRQHVGPQLGRARHAERHGASVGIPREPFRCLSRVGKCYRFRVAGVVTWDVVKIGTL